jgi:Ca-activated chloride channel family protein
MADAQAQAQAQTQAEVEAGAKATADQPRPAESRAGDLLGESRSDATAAEPPGQTEAAGDAALDAQQREALQAADQWLRRIPDDPAELLRRKFLYQYQTRQGVSDLPTSGQPW